MSKPVGSKNKSKPEDLRGEFLTEGLDFVPEWLIVYRRVPFDVQAQMLIALSGLLFPTDKPKIESE